MDFRIFALNMIKQNPNYQQMMNNPNSAELIHILETGDAEAGAKVAQNICDTYGVTKEQSLVETAMGTTMASVAKDGGR